MMVSGRVNAHLTLRYTRNAHILCQTSCGRRISQNCPFHGAKLLLVIIHEISRFLGLNSPILCYRTSKDVGFPRPVVAPYVRRMCGIVLSRRLQRGSINKRATNIQHSQLVLAFKPCTVGDEQCNLYPTDTVSAG